jgi:drug/metabolite transporter (DMT)-like permease|tara:strand:- start:1612 stop:2469 length:858 start_codon:yes stop_codon:yes gene_type:complete
MLGFSVLVAGSFSLGSIIANDISPIALTAVRFILAAIVIGIIAISTGSVTQAALKSPWRYLVLGGIFSVYFVLMFEGLKTATPVSTVAIFTLIPAVSAIAGFVILGQIVSSRIVVALIIGALGALWVIFRADIQLLSTFSIGRGELIFFVGCIAHAIMPILFRLLNRGENPLMVTFGLLISGAIILCIIGAREIIETDWIGLPTIVWVVIFYVSICASAMTFVLLQFASMHLPATNVMAYTYLTPIWVLVWELFLGHSVPPLWVLGGVFLAVVSVTLLLKTSLDN